MIRKTECDKCKRSVTNNNFARHYASCDGTFFTGPVRPKERKKFTGRSEKWYAAMAASRGTTARNQYSKAKELGLPKPVMSEETRKKKSDASRKQKHSDETRKKISKARLKYLQENPDKVPYRLNHYSKGRSYPEEYWKGILDSHGIVYEEQHPVGIYQLDFAILESKVDLEIDGDQHYLDPRIMKSDLRRNKYLEDLGWKIIRIKWSAYKKLVDKQSYINYVISILK